MADMEEKLASLLVEKLFEQQASYWRLKTRAKETLLGQARKKKGILLDGFEEGDDVFAEEDGDGESKNNNNNNNNNNDWDQLIPLFLRESGLDVMIRNVVHMNKERFKQSSAIEQKIWGRIEEPFDFIRDSQVKFGKKVFRRLNMVAKDNKCSLGSPRPPSAQKIPKEKYLDFILHTNLSTATFLYDQSDLFEEAIALKNMNFVPQGVDFVEDVEGKALCWKSTNAIPVQFKTSTLAELRQRFSLLNVEHVHIGVDDGFVPGKYEHNRAWRATEAKQVIRGGLGAEARSFLRQGAPMSMRGDLYVLALAPEIDTYSVLYDQLWREVLKHDLLMDRLFSAEVRFLSSVDDNYFVFEDYMMEILLCFSRDKTVFESISSPRPEHILARAPLQYADQGSSEINTCLVNYPPSGVLVYRGMVNFLAPLCFLFDDPAKVYNIFKALYCKHFVRLHTISSHSDSIFSLGIQFEALLQKHQPFLASHLSRIGCDPLKIAFPWMACMFVGVLDTDQVLYVLDRIIGFETLELLPLLAVSIFSFRRLALMEARSHQEVCTMLEDLRVLRAIPLLQYALFAEDIAASSSVPQNATIS